MMGVSPAIEIRDLEQFGRGVQANVLVNNFASDEGLVETVIEILDGGGDVIAGQRFEDLFTGFKQVVYSPQFDLGSLFEPRLSVLVVTSVGD